MKFQKFFALFLLLFLNACALKNTPEQSQGIYFSFLTNEIKISDAGFLNQNKEELKLEIYKLATPILKLKIGKEICLNQACYAKQVFNAKYLKNAYYDEILSEILQGKEIFQGKNLKKINCGFSQNISSKNFDIYYEICGKNIKFHDKKNNIKIILKTIN